MNTLAITLEELYMMTILFWKEENILKLIEHPQLQILFFQFWHLLLH